MKSAAEWRPEVEDVLDSKLEEFRMLGYPKVTKEALWECLCNHVWKNSQEGLKLHRIVADIFFLQPGTYMNYMARNAYRDNDLLASIQAIAEFGKKADSVENGTTQEESGGNKQ
ncbi:post-transcriptional regulator [Aciduricibacillus chroicocephali]|uniref:Post-transcriptional regulator n=1 Tax=Aciduricibacillus chroicocephali TaxID=3054939 RepID=A0ABY9KYV9_9BACI|nr:post-transcriptional regulator [Bacillaceae bacterium 44XB]